MSQSKSRLHRVRPKHAIAVRQSQSRAIRRQRKQQVDPMSDPLYRILHKIAAVDGIQYAAKVGGWFAGGLVWAIAFRLSLKLTQIGIASQSLSFTPMALLLMISLTGSFLLMQTIKKYPEFKVTVSFLGFWALIGVFAGVADSALRGFGA